MLTGEPFVTRMTNAGLGTVGARYAAELERTEPIIFYAASREWAEKNPDTIKKFRAAIAEAAPIVNNDREKASASISKFTKQPLELVKATPPNRSEPVLKPSNWLVDRHHVVAEDVAEQARSRQADPEIGESMPWRAEPHRSRKTFRARIR